MPHSNRPGRVLAASALVVAVAWSGLSLAAVTLDMRDSDSASAKISLKDPTRVRVNGARITDVRGSVIRTKDNPGGVLVAALDEDKGDLYLQPVQPRGMPPATSIFVSTERATYTLLLVPMDIPADTIVIRDRGSVASLSSPSSKRLPNHERELIALLKSVADQRAPASMVTNEVNQPVALWREAHFVLLRRYEGHPRWIVEAFELTNVSGAPMVLDEREFLTEGVAAVGLEQIILAPGEIVPVSIVREVMR
jgi:conjugal transfer pilus assembly protein TraK